MDFLDIMKMFLLIILFNCWCYCQSAYLTLKHEDTSIVKNEEVKPFLDKSVDSEMECYMKCLGDQDNCCLIEMKKKAGKVNQCLLYSISPVYLRKVYEKHSKITSVIDKDCKLRKSCLEWYQKGEKKDGVYKIHVKGKPVNVFCDMTTSGGGWTVFQKRFDGSVSFARKWNDYKSGFGDVSGEYWLGNDLIHQLTKKAGGTLINFKTTNFDNVSKYITMKGFQIDSEDDKYKMHFGNGVEGDSYLLDHQNAFSYSNESYFTTIDQDNDKWGPTNCAASHGGSGGFWYGSCSRITANSGYPDSNCNDEDSCIRWANWEAGKSFTFLKFFQISLK